MLAFHEEEQIQNKSFCALKLDMMKAYDRLEWCYLEAMLEKLRLDSAWIDIVMGMVKQFLSEHFLMVRSLRSSSRPEVFGGETPSPPIFS